MSGELIAAINRITGHNAGDGALFIEALTHGSHGARDYQRLEFLGDRVLGLIVAEALFERFPQESEGALSARLNQLVTGTCCAEVARQLELPTLIRLGKQARDDGGRDSDNILGDVMEALIGALFIDAGWPATRSFVIAAWGDRIAEGRTAPKHPKSALLEWAAAHKRKPPEYRLLRREGPDHAPRFLVGVAVLNAGAASASGSSKQDAETAAARALLEQLSKDTA